MYLYTQYRFFFLFIIPILYIFSHIIIFHWIYFLWIVNFIRVIVFFIFSASLLKFVLSIFNDSKIPQLEKNDKCFGKDEKLVENSNEIRKFKVNISDEFLNDLHRRLKSYRSHEPLAGTKFNHGFNPEYLKKVVHYWRTQFDWRRQESELNKFNQFTTKINGLKIHFIHVKPLKPTKTVVPILLIHGWPGSIWEYYKSIPLLTETKDDIAFEVICPSLPGYGFSEAPNQPGFDMRAIAAIFVKLMKLLNHDKFFVHGGDFGYFISKMIAILYPKHVYGMHMTLCSFRFSMRLKPTLKYMIGAYFPSLVLENHQNDYKKIYPFWKTFIFFVKESGYFHIQSTKPDTIGIALNDSPVGMAAYILEKFAIGTNQDNVDKFDGGLTEKFTLDELLTNIMIYWISNNVASSMRYYKQNFLYVFKKDVIKVPSAYADFPFEINRSTKSMVEQECIDLVQYTEMPRGGHFAAFEEPLLLTDDIRNFVEKVLKK